VKFGSKKFRLVTTSTEATGGGRKKAKGKDALVAPRHESNGVSPLGIFINCEASAKTEYGGKGGGVAPRQAVRTGHKKTPPPSYTRNEVI